MIEVYEIDDKGLTFLGKAIARLEIAISRDSASTGC